MVETSENTTNATFGVTTYYIIEHFEEEFSDWTLSEYVHMILILSRLYDKGTQQGGPPHKEVLVITNFPFIAKYNRGELGVRD